MTQITKMMRRAPDTLALDVLGGVWLVTLVMGMLHLPSVL